MESYNIYPFVPGFFYATRFSYFLFYELSLVIEFDFLNALTLSDQNLVVTQ